MPVTTTIITIRLATEKSRDASGYRCCNCHNWQPVGANRTYVPWRSSFRVAMQRSGSTNGDGWCDSCVTKHLTKGSN